MGIEIFIYFWDLFGNLKIQSLCLSTVHLASLFVQLRVVSFWLKLDHLCSISIIIINLHLKIHNIHL